MTEIKIPSGPDPDRFTRRIDELRNGLLGVDPLLLAERTQSAFRLLQDERGEFQLPLWGRQVAIAYPEFVARDLATGAVSNPMHQALLLYYFYIADGMPISGQWLSFSELPDGRFYNQAFQGYTGRQLARVFTSDRQSFERAAQGLGGVSASLGDASYVFQALPRAPLLVVFWQGDEDFPSSFQILFDASACHYLPTDGYAILGSTLTHRLIAARNSLGTA
ncbi:MAG: DUF3786 domain-containing protein [Anaerolineales bacterium]|nr:DUF3786 domain-containing protein [Anaerolineales bacterium]